MLSCRQEYYLSCLVRRLINRLRVNRRAVPKRRPLQGAGLDRHPRLTAIHNRWKIFLIEIVDSQVIDVETKTLPLFINEIATSSSFLWSEERSKFHMAKAFHTKIPHFHTLTLGKAPALSALSACKIDSNLSRSAFSRTSLLSTSSLQTNRQNDQEN